MTLQEVIGHLNPRHLKSADEYRMMCPFRENHTKLNPGITSFVLSTSGNWYHCFSCSSRGTAMSLLTTKFKVPFTAAMDIVSVTNTDNFLVGAEKKEFTLDDYWDIKPPKYFLDKGIYPRILKNFRVGYTYTPLGEQEIRIPFYNQRGKLIAVKHRIDGTRNFWYNPTDWDKLHYLYNYNNIGSTATMVEGETDLWKSLQHGTMDTCAILGGGIGYEQSKMLRNLSSVKTAFDNDPTGWKYTELWYHHLKPYVPDFRIVMYSGKDPCDCNEADWLYGHRHAIDYGEYSLVMMQEFGDEYLKIQDDAIKMLRKKSLL